MAPTLNVKTSTLIASAAAGITLGAVVGYFIYRRRRTSVEDADEGIGDVDSIISESEINIDDDGACHSVSDSTYVTVTSAATASRSDIGDYVEAQVGCHDNDDVICNNEESTTTDQVTASRLPVKPMKVLVLGLSECGKTSMLNLLAHQPVQEDYKPTKGFNAIQIEKSGIVVSIMEVGGGSGTREYWKNFTNDTSLLIYVVDGSNASRFKESRVELKKLLDESLLEGIACLLISSKQDISGALKANEIFTARDLTDIAKKGLSNITLLNMICTPRSNGSSDGDVIMDVILTMLQEL
ncbi:ADP-ribosylation factor-like protein 8A [Clavelina lepadiformis]|uniref:ADP-ribosylation factor-like protein 8A n=1 Tax=Clavelina lepadiformis TaxID=159417 RepID=UPI004042756A